MSDMAETPGADRYSNPEGTWRQHATILEPVVGYLRLAVRSTLAPQGTQRLLG